MIVVNPVKQKDGKLSVYSLSSLENWKYYYRTVQPFENSCPSRYKGTFIFIFFKYRVTDLAHYWLVTHECAALNTPELFPSKMVAFELTRKMCSEQGEAAF